MPSIMPVKRDGRTLLWQRIHLFFGFDQSVLYLQLILNVSFLSHSL